MQSLNIKFLIRTGIVTLLLGGGLFFVQQTISMTQAKEKNKLEEKKTSAASHIEQEKLATLNGIVGDWRGVGMLRRGSTRGAWTEKANWVWNFEKKQPSISYKVKDGKYVKSASILYDRKEKQYVMQVDLPDETTREYRGDWEKKQLLFISRPQKDGYVYRISIRPLNEKRTILLQEKRKTMQTFFSRIAEVGYTRKGTSLAVEGAGEPVCVVTGGKGTIKVSYKGKEYYVCCSGCKDAFEEDPEGIIAEYKKRIAQKK